MAPAPFRSTSSGAKAGVRAVDSRFVFGRLIGGTLAALLICGAARAQEPPSDAPLPTPSTPPLLSPEAAPETSDESQAATLYEQAVAADARGQRLAARELAQRALEASPNGRYALALS